MKSSKMRSGFTMIELIFVIVVLGILAAVAMPKFVNVQDDAKVSSEKSTIGAVRSAIGMLHGKAIIKNGNFAVKITAPVENSNATTKTLAILVSDELYPIGLSITTQDGNSAKLHDDNTNVVKNNDAVSNVTADFLSTKIASKGGEEYSDTQGNGEATLASVLDLEGRTDWATGAVETASGTDGAYKTGMGYTKQILEGPASTSTGVKDDYTVNEFDVDSDGAWQYDAITGTIVYRENDGLDNEGKPNALTYTSATN
jgi:prepilin-type N-terminal cleavage/methylation domain-containing protein